jgi:restriction endonuclease S subunit
MGVIGFKTKLSKLNTDTSVRLDAKFANFIESEPEKQWNCINFCVLKDVLTPLNSPIYKKGELEENMYLIDLANIERKANNLINLEPVSEIGSDKCLIKNGDLIIPKIEPKKGQLFLNLKHNEYLGSTELIEYQINTDKYNPIFLYSLLTSDIALKTLSFLESGKTHKRVNSESLLKLKIPFVSISIQKEKALVIEKIRNEILKLKNSRLKPVGIINQVFSKSFGFDWRLVEKLQENKIHKAKFIHFANDELKFDLSLKTRFIFNNYIKAIKNLSWISLNKIVYVKGGKRLPKGQNVLEDETDYKYVRVDDLSWDGSFDLENVKYITEKNHLAIKNYIANENDILLTIVGATVGKCGLVPEILDGENITENYARLIIKDKEAYLPEYVNYCLMSKSSQIQFDEYTGKSSQGKLAIFRIKKVLIPELKPDQQAEIVEIIKTQLDAQKEIDRQIEEKQQAINKIIEDAIKQEQN